MIFEVLFNLFIAAVSFVLGLLPSWEPIDFSGMDDALNGLLGGRVATLLHWANYYVPLREASLLIPTAFGIWASLLVYRTVVEWLTRVHILGGRG